MTLILILVTLYVIPKPGLYASYLYTYFDCHILFMTQRTEQNLFFLLLVNSHLDPDSLHMQSQTRSLWKLTIFQFSLKLVTPNSLLSRNCFSIFHNCDLDQSQTPSACKLPTYQVSLKLVIPNSCFWAETVFSILGTSDLDLDSRDPLCNPKLQLHESYL